jgi:3-methyladenine DNA glycosylase AlkD
MHPYLIPLQKQLKASADSENAFNQAAYMKNKFKFFGLTTDLRREVCKPFLQKDILPAKQNVESIVKTLWEMPQREYHYFAQELLAKYQKQFQEEDIGLLEYLIVNNSWWDSVDFIAANLIGQYFKLYPKKRKAYITKWISSGNMWLQRTCLLFQLKYKKETDTALLTDVIKKLTPSKEFFINKAIGWALREYSKTDPKWVKDFVSAHSLSNLSKKEALKVISK